MQDRSSEKLIREIQRKHIELTSLYKELDKQLTESQGNEKETSGNINTRKKVEVRTVHKGKVTQRKPENFK